MLRAVKYSYSFYLIQVYCLLFSLKNETLILRTLIFFSISKRNTILLGHSSK